MNTPLDMRGNARLTRLFSRQTIAARVQELGGQISRDYRGQEILLVGVLKGAFVFLADLMCTLQVAAQVEFVRLASYGTGTTSGGQVRMMQDLEGSIVGRHGQERSSGQRMRHFATCETFCRSTERLQAYTKGE